MRVLILGGDGEEGGGGGGVYKMQSNDERKMGTETHKNSQRDLRLNGYLR